MPNVDLARYEAPSDAVLRLRVRGRAAPRTRDILAAANLRAMALPTMNIDAVLVDDSWRRRPTA